MIEIQATASAMNVAHARRSRIYGSVAKSDKCKETYPLSVVSPPACKETKRQTCDRYYRPGVYAIERGDFFYNLRRPLGVHLLDVSKDSKH